MLKRLLIFCVCFVVVVNLDNSAMMTKDSYMIEENQSEGDNRSLVQSDMLDRKEQYDAEDINQYGEVEDTDQYDETDDTDETNMWTRMRYFSLKCNQAKDTPHGLRKLLATCDVATLTR